MKKYYKSFLLCLLATFLLFGCEKKPTLEPRDQKPYDVNDLLRVMNDLPDQKALEFICDSLNGYWTSNDIFVGFSNGDGIYYFEDGFFQTEILYKGEIIKGIVSGENSMTLTVHFPEVPANEVNDGYSEFTAMIFIDISHFNSDGRINVKVEDEIIVEWLTFEYGGKSLQEAFENR